MASPKGAPVRHLETAMSIGDYYERVCVSRNNLREVAVCRARALLEICENKAQWRK
jgi:hypothetical protein